MVPIRAEPRQSCRVTPAPARVPAAGPTRAPAAVFGLPDRGRIAPGLRADLVLVRGEPERDVTRTRAVEVVWRCGHALGLPGPTRPPTAG